MPNLPGSSSNIAVQARKRKARYGTYSTCRREAKESMRARLIEATCAVICDVGPHRVTIDSVALIAGTSRSTFYFHFQSINDVLEAVRKILIELIDNHYDNLPDLCSVSAEELGRWAHGILSLCRANRSLSYALLYTSKGAAVLYDTEAYCCHTIRRLAPRIPLFARALEDDLIMAEVILLLAQIETIVRIFVHRDESVDEQNYISVVGRNLHAAFALGADR